MREEIQASLMEALTRVQNYKGETVIDKFDTMSISDFGIGLYNAIPLYSDEVVDLVLDIILFPDKKGIVLEEFVNTKIRKLMAIYVTKNRDTNLLTSLTFWINLQNRLLNDAELQKQEEDYRRYLFSFLLPNLEAVVNQVELDKIKGESYKSGERYIRFNENGFIPTEETKQLYKHFIDY